MTHLQVNFFKEVIVLDQSNISIEEINLISQNDLFKLSLPSQVVLFLFFQDMT